MSAELASREDWLSARKQLLEKEKAMARAQADLAAERRQLPAVRIERDYHFDTNDGQRSLSELFEGRGQLIVVHFMFGPDWEEGCPSCSFWADTYSGVGPHLAARDTTLVVSSNAALEKLNAYKARLGWNFNWVSAGDSTFSADFGVSFHNGDETELQD